MKISKRVCVIYGLIGFSFCFFQLVGHDLAKTDPAVRDGITEIGNIEWTVGYVLRTAGISIAAGTAFGVLCGWISGRSDRSEKSGKQARDTSRDRHRLVWAVSLVLLLLCWTPCYLAY